MYTFRVPDKRRPVLIFIRKEVIDHLNEVIVAPATRTIRGLTTEVVLTTNDGMPARARCISITLRWRSGIELVRSSVACRRPAGPK